MVAGGDVLRAAGGRITGDQGASGQGGVSRMSGLPHGAVRVSMEAEEFLEIFDFVTIFCAKICGPAGKICSSKFVGAWDEIYAYPKTAGTTFQRAKAVSTLVRHIRSLLLQPPV